MIKILTKIMTVRIKKNIIKMMYQKPKQIIKGLINSIKNQIKMI